MGYHRYRTSRREGIKDGLRRKAVDVASWESLSCLMLLIRSVPKSI